ncbi:MAG: maleylpyruvate isomerase family mycothiol-dependent enzyme [Nocardioidaceae bacterium]|nr:maleylpyruvate isomerase family mycothiol-dependent enzyme [Nocardioidaceae bacterium]NUS51825.1 maleylpyruvate isomerase family mycothiol-dependent enzyme [Nocardioidaceae bacterium]
MTDDLDTALAALHRSHDRLTRTLASLDDEQVAGPSYHSWSIAQVASHLGSQAEVFGLFLEAGRTGDPSPGMEEFQKIWARWDAKAPADQARDSGTANRAFLDQVDALGDDEREKWRLDLFGAESDLTGLVRMKLSEHAVHTWDVQAALDPAATLPEDAVTEILSNVGGLTARAGKPDGAEADVAVVTAGPERSYRLRLAGDSATLTEEATHGAPTLALPAEALLRLLYGRLDADHTPTGVRADGVDLDLLRRSFPGF